MGAGGGPCRELQRGGSSEGPPPAYDASVREDLLRGHELSRHAGAGDYEVDAGCLCGLLGLDVDVGVVAEDGDAGGRQGFGVLGVEVGDD